MADLAAAANPSTHDTTPPDEADAPESRTLECIGVRTDTPSVKTFRFRDTHADGRLRFAAGQAAMLTLTIDGARVNRTFSIASSPLDPDALELTVKANPGGTVSRWMHDTLTPGTRVTARYPLGRFALDRAEQGPLALVSAGSGATPLMSMLRVLAQSAPDADVAWVHAARSIEEILFADELAQLQTRMPKLRVSVTLTAPVAGWFGLRGRLTRGMLSAMVPDFGRRTVYCCGPAAFMGEVRRMHAAEGARRAAFHLEHFGPVIETLDAAAADAGTPTMLPTASPGDDGPVHHATLGARRFDIRHNETILAAASRQQVVIPCGCASGLCGTCRLRRVSGAVEMRHAGGLSAADEQQGWVLACSSRPLSDLELAF